MFFIFQTFIQKYGKIILPLGIIGVAILFYFQKPFSQDETSLITTVPPQQQLIEENEESVPEEDIQIMVDVKGAVHHPGVYELTTDQRIIDAIQMAGGYLEDAETTLINHAQKLEDEMVIFVPKKGETYPPEIHDSIQAFTPNVSNSSSKETSKVNINSATESELLSLPGIGPAKAQAIISYRQEQGAFKQIEDIKNISGIGDKTFEKLKDMITVR